MPAVDLQVIEAFKILQSDKQVKAIMVNIFGEPLRLAFFALATAVERQARDGMQNCEV